LHLSPPFYSIFITAYVELEGELHTIITARNISQKTKIFLPFLSYLLPILFTDYYTIVNHLVILLKGLKGHL